MIDDDTPRSYTSPRDDRFFTPRTIARSNSASNSDEWSSPRFDGDFQTPRSYIDTDRSNRSFNPGMMHAKDYYGGENQSYTAQAKQFYNNYSQQDAKFQANNNNNNQTQNAQPKSARKHYIAEEVQQAKYGAEPPSANNYEQEINEPDYAALGFIEQDIEEIFSYARHGRCEEIERKLNEGLPVDVRDEFGNTMLITACQNGNKRVAKAVLRRGADINARNYKGNTPLHYCYHCKNRQFSVTQSKYNIHFLF
jgi:hypothetical protein